MKVIKLKKEEDCRILSVHEQKMIIGGSGSGSGSKCICYVFFNQELTNGSSRDVSGESQPQCESACWNECVNDPTCSGIGYTYLGDNSGEEGDENLVITSK